MRIIGIGGGAASGKSTLARALCAQRPESEFLALDDYFLMDCTGGPWTEPDGEGRRFFDLNNPAALDLPRVLARIGAVQAKLLVIEGHHALSFPELRARMELKVFVHLDDDLRLGRKIVRNFQERGTDPVITFRNYLNSGRPGHARFIAPTADDADLILSGLKATGENVAAILSRLSA